MFILELCLARPRSHVGDSLRLALALSFLLPEEIQ
jgi:hypothetical protein